MVADTFERRPLTCRGARHDMFWTGRTRRGKGDWRIRYERKCRRCGATGWALSPTR
jgi:hypothetical protein